MKKIILVILLSGLILVGCQQQSKEKSVNENEDIDVIERSIKDFTFISEDSKNEKNMVLYSKFYIGADSIFDYKYLLLNSALNVYDKEKEISFLRDFVIFQYDLKTKDEQHRYKISEFINKTHPELTPLMFNYLTFYKNEAQKEIPIENIIEKKTHKQNIYINPRTKEMQWGDFKPDNVIKNSDITKKSKEIYTFIDEKKSQVVNEKNKSSLTFFVGMSAMKGFQLSFSPIFLPKDNTQLYEMFPKLKEYRSKEDSYITLLLDSTYTAEEVVSLFLEKGQKIEFQGKELIGQ